MRDTSIVVTICLHVGIVLSKIVRQPCYSVKNGLCGKGQYLLIYGSGGHTCADCPDNTFLDYVSHVCERCKNRTQPNWGEVIARPGDTTSDNVIVCKRGFYKVLDPRLETSRCEICSVCNTGTWAARECSSERDTVCCPLGTVAAQSGDSVACLLKLLPNPSHIPASRQESPQEDSRGNNFTSSGVGNEVSSDNNDELNDGPDEETDNNDKLNDGPDEKSEDSTHLVPQHGYSRVTDLVPQHGYSRVYEEQKREMVEIPMWGRYLFVGIGVGIVVFFLGVGIPCNACGSLDKLRHLKGLIFKPNDRQPAEEESKQPMNTSSNAV